MADDDAELVQGCRRGEAAAFEALVARYQRRVIGLCYRHIRDYEGACDLAQEIFARAFQHLAEFQGHSSFSTWLYRISLNACYNRSRYSRAKGRDTATSLEGLLERSSGGVDSVPALAGPEPGALERLETDEELAQLREALADLAQDQRRVVELVDIEELSYAEAAEVLGLPVNTVRSRLNRARVRLKGLVLRLRARRGVGAPPTGRRNA